MFKNKFYDILINNNIDKSNNKLLDEIFHVFKSAIVKVSDKKILEVFKNSYKDLKVMKKQELEEKNKEDIELSELEKELEKII